MASADPPNRDIPSDDELDAIINGTYDGGDIFDTSNIDAQLQAQSSQPPGNKKSPADDVLGLNEEVKVTKKKQPVPKLDDKLLLSELGIPKLQKISKDRLKLKGKGHEYGDVARLLNMYQLWLDGLFPRAKFADGLFMIEKLGHTKNIQRMRKEWIDEGKPRPKSDSEDEGQDEMMIDQPLQNSIETGNSANTNTSPKEQAGTTEQIERTEHSAVEPVLEPDEDELDALLAEGGLLGTTTSTNPAPKAVAAEEDPFADEMEAMADMEDMW